MSDESKLLDALREVVDPELMINVVDLGLVYEIDHDPETKKARVAMTLTSPACPAGPQIMQQARMALERLHDVDEAEIRLVMSPPWSPERMTDEARDQLGIF
jgi:metal-sulfur cluster biosynthetic enzyme